MSSILVILPGWPGLGWRWRSCCCGWEGGGAGGGGAAGAGGRLARGRRSWWDTGAAACTPKGSFRRAPRLDRPEKKHKLLTSVSDPDQNSGVYWIRIQIQSHKKFIILNHHKIILLFKTLYLSIDFFWRENLIIITGNSLDPDSFVFFIRIQIFGRIQIRIQ